MLAESQSVSLGSLRKEASSGSLLVCWVSVGSGVAQVRCPHWCTCAFMAMLNIKKW